MNILVCVKQVPDTTEIKIDPVTNTLVRSGVPSIANPFDMYALEMAVRYKEAHGGTITALCMGPEQAKAVIKECLSVGAEKGYLVSDRAFGGSDTLATSYIIAAAAKKLGPFDLIFCGKQAIDGDTGQVGPEVAEHLDIPQVTYAVDMEPAAREGTIRIKREIEDGYELVEVGTPAVISVTKTGYEPRYSNIKSKMAASRAVIPVLTCADLELDTTRIGLKGSPTKVKKTFTPVHSKECHRIQCGSRRDEACMLLQMLSDQKVI